MVKPGIFVSALFLFAAGCGGDDGGLSVEWKSVETRPDGSRLIRYSEFPDDRLILADADLRIGSADAEDVYILGDVRGVDVASDGTIYVFDRQASEIRAYDDDGRYVRTIASSGNGPGEITEANGMHLVGDSVLWVFDHDRRRINAFGLLGGERASFVAPIGSWDYVWNGVFDEKGWFWKEMSTNYSSGSFSREEGLRESSADTWLLSYDYRTGARDSLLLGRRSTRGYVAELTNGHMVMRIPNDPEWFTAVDPAGGIWRMLSDTYELVRIDVDGDTLVAVEVAIDPPPVTEENLQTMLNGYRESYSDLYPILEKALQFSPDVKPLTLDLSVDEESRLWLMRSVPDGAKPLFDIFDREGNYVASVRLSFEIQATFPIRVRDDRIYALSTDSLGAPTIVRTRPLEIEDGS